MGKINILSFAVANLIAAGEVVDRPASVIKELMENAIDAGGKQITVEIQNGGVTFMRVTDNGCGMSPEDLPIAIKRHATSKIKNAEDLDGIITLGFRGEALAAIASVSHLRILTKTKDAAFGAMLESVGGENVHIRECGCADGTTVIVEDLFANVPARRKFLKKDMTEAMAVTANVEKLALSHPEIGFRLIVDGNMRMETAGDGDLKHTIYSVFGKDFASKMIAVEGQDDSGTIRVSGFIGRSDNVKANRNYQNYFINGRYVKSKTACAAVEQAFCSYLPPEKFPACVLNLAIVPGAVDVNVHPAKLEVKFTNEKPVFETIYYSVRNALEQNVTRPQLKIEQVQSGEHLSAGQVKDLLYAGNATAQRAKPVSNAFVPVPDRIAEAMKKNQIRMEFPGGEQTAKEKPAVATPKTPVDTSAGQPAVAIPPIRTAKEPENTVSPAAETAKAEQPRGTQAENKPFRASLSETDFDLTIPFPDISAVSENKTENAKRHEEKLPKEAENSQPQAEDPAATPQKEESPSVPAYRIIGEAFHAYVLVESEQRLLLIDKHAAHERILFEQLKVSLKKQEQLSQMLMLPLEFTLSSEDRQTLEDFRTEIEAIGFCFETEESTVRVSGIPCGIEANAVPDMFMTFADRARNNTGSATLTRDILFEKALYQASCKAAIKAGRDYADAHIEWIVDKLMRLPDITFCPHGRPVAIELSKANLDHQFHRT